MAESILSSLLSEPSFVITNDDGEVILKTISIKSVKITYLSDPMRHQLEDGSAKIDTRIIRPTTLEVTLFTPDVDAMTEVQTVFANREKMFHITSKGLEFANMQASTNQLMQSHEVMSGTPIRMTFTQRLVEGFLPIICKDAADASLIDKGISAIDDLKSTAMDMFDKVTGAIESGLNQVSELL